MKAEIIAVGTELLLGQIENSNAKYLSERMAALGIDAFWQTVVGDNRKRFSHALEQALSRSDIIIVCGGMGSTSDDLTRGTAAQVLGLPLELSKAWLDYQEERYKKRKRPLPDSCRDQALVPKGSSILWNRYGSAPGVWLEDQGRILVLLPGPPNELQPLFEEEVVPLMRKLDTSDKKIISRVLRIVGISEHRLEKIIGNLMTSSNPTIAPLAGMNEVLLRLTVKAGDEESVRMLDETERFLRAKLGTAVYARDDETMQEAAAALLMSNKMTVATAESCTGGLLAHLLTNVPGSSSFFMQGVVPYSNSAKIDLLGINPEILREHGAVSSQTAKAMAENMKAKAATDFALAITGLAGPAGDGRLDEPGLVYIALASGEQVSCQKFNFNGKREEIKSQAAFAALNMLRLSVIN